MANLSFFAAGRRRKLYRRKASGPYHVRFQFRWKDIVRSLGTTVEATAKEKAKQHIEAAVAGNEEGSRRLKIKSDYCTPGHACNIYRQRFGTSKRRLHTAQQNIGSLSKILRIGGDGATLHGSRSTILTGQIIEQFEKEELKRISRDPRGHMNQESERSVRTSICSVVRQARSIFRPAILNWYDDLALPDLTSFRQQGVTAPKRRKPRPLDEGVIEQINTAAPALRREDPACYVSHLLFKYLGMRNIEQKAARWPWIRLTPELRDKGIAAKMDVIFRPGEEFEPKGNEGSISIAPWVLSELQTLRAESPDGDFIVPAKHATERERIIDDRHSAWAGQWIKNRAKVSYELRRYAGALLYRQTRNIQYVQQFLRHADLKTTMDWYWYLLDEVPAIDPGTCISAVENIKIVA